MIKEVIKSVLVKLITLAIINLVFFYFPMIPIKTTNPCLVAPCPEFTEAYTPSEAIINSSFYLKYVEKIGAFRIGQESFMDAVHRILNRDVLIGNGVLLVLLFLIFPRFRKN
ncbi:MAG: hypothetical protein WCW78_00440 [Candidatus Paceibacterota bacterium]|jgi:hypothetical protein